jgi:hypothetical protein
MPFPLPLPLPPQYTGNRGNTWPVLAHPRTASKANQHTSARVAVIARNVLGLARPGGGVADAQLARIHACTRRATAEQRRRPVTAHTSTQAHLVTGVCERVRMRPSCAGANVLCECACAHERVDVRALVRAPHMHILGHITSVYVQPSFSLHPVDSLHGTAGHTIGVCVHCPVSASQVPVVHFELGQLVWSQRRPGSEQSHWSVWRLHVPPATISFARRHLQHLSVEMHTREQAGFKDRVAIQPKYGVGYPHIFL